MQAYPDSVRQVVSKPQVSLSGLPTEVELSVVVAIHDERAALEAGFLEGMHRVLERFQRGGAEILVVDDGSTDGSAEYLNRWSQQERDADPSRAQPTLPGGLSLVKRRLHRHNERRGSGAARRVGSILAQGRLVAWIDGDGSYDPNDILRLAEALHQNGTVAQVVGTRGCDHGMLAGAKYQTKRSVARLAGLLWRQAIPDLNSGLRVFRREGLPVWLDQLPPGFSCTSTATLAALNAGQKVIFLPISYRARTAGGRSKFHRVYDSARLLKVVWRQWRQREGSAAGNARAEVTREE